MKKQTQMEVREILIDAYNKINKLKKKGISKKYLIKVGYILFWLRLIPCNYKFLNNWRMPDTRTIYNIKNKQPLNICFCTEVGIKFIDKIDKELEK
jgi:hypothetical protein